MADEPVLQCAKWARIRRAAWRVHTCSLSQETSCTPRNSLPWSMWDMQTLPPPRSLWVLQTVAPPPLVFTCLVDNPGAPEVWDPEMQTTGHRPADCCSPDYKNLTKDQEHRQILNISSYPLTMHMEGILMDHVFLEFSLHNNIICSALEELSISHIEVKNELIPC